MQGTKLVVVSLYLTDGLGLAGLNIQKLSQLAAWLRLVARPWIVFADWNATPEQVGKWPYISETGQLLIPVATDITCTRGAGRILDFA